MERQVKKITDLDKIRWRNIGGGTFRMAGGKIIQPGETFSARVIDIPQSFRDVIKPIDEYELQDTENVIVEMNYTLKARGGGWFDVIGPTEKVMNDKALKREEALAFIESLK